MNFNPIAAVSDNSCSDPADKKEAVITARVGTLKRKQQMREFLEQLPKDNHDDVFATTPFQKRKVQVNLGQQHLWDCSPAGCARAAPVPPIQSWASVGRGFYSTLGWWQ